MPEGKKPPVKRQPLRDGKEVSAMGWTEDVHGAVLLVKQKRGRKFWTLPGGKIHANEGVETGLKREIREETGARTISATQMALFDRPAKRNITFLYRVSLQTVKSWKPTPSEIASVEYHSKLPPDASPSLKYFWKLLRPRG
ncbi:MAG TPA: NUDIX hydrolase [Chthoniobacterales bacterium]|nr:NUDIX hydrolase [Chthoniobacterales bacterium]